MQEVKAGEKITIEDVAFQILWPIEKQIEENQLNNNAMVMKLQYKNFSMLFTGDIEEVAEKKMLDTYKNHLDMLKATILKVAHHGSKSSSTEEFLKTVNSKVAMIGVGENNMFGHPSNVVLERLQLFGMQIFRTDQDGEISIKVNHKGRIDIEKFIEESNY